MENFTRKYEYLADVHYWYLHGYFAYDYKNRFLSQRRLRFLHTYRISIQTAGLVGGTGLCSYRVRGVDGSYAEHLTIESCTVVICQQSYLLLLVFHHPLILSFQA